MQAPPRPRVDCNYAPPVIRRAFRRWFLMLGAGVALLALALLFLVKGWISGVLATTVAIVLAIVVFGGDLFVPVLDWCFGRSEGRLIREARESGFRACPNCMYVLEAASGICPECGVEYTLADVRACWREASPADFP